MKISLISPKEPLHRHRCGIFKRSLRHAPLTRTTLASLRPPELDAEVTLVGDGFEDADLELTADVVWTTVITGTTLRALNHHFRSPGIPVVTV